MEQLPSSTYRPLQRHNSNTFSSRNHKQLHFQQVPQYRQPHTVEEEQQEDDDDEVETPRALSGVQRDSCASFNSLYDMSDDDSAIVPLKLSNSTKAAVRKPVKHARLPSLVIPSPSAWPTIQKVKAGTAKLPATGILLSPIKTPLSPQALARLCVQSTLQIPAVNATPSLDGSLTSDEVASLGSCNTPSTYHADDDDAASQWELPIRADIQPMDGLLEIAFDRAVAAVPVQEMSERSRPGSRVLFATNSIVEAVPASAIELPSATSLLSPQGFFSTLDSPSKRVWNPKPVESAESTQPGESAEDVTTGQRNQRNQQEQQKADEVTEQRIHICSDCDTDGPPTARKDSYDSSEYTTVDELIIPENRQYEYDEEYEDKLHREATTNMSRTSLWLSAQDDYLAALTRPSPLPGSSIQSPRSVSPVASQTTPASPPRKGVRFADPEPTAVVAAEAAETVETAETADPKQKADALFYHAFQHLLATNSVESAFSHRNIRASALATQRRYMADKHLRQLSGDYCLPAGASVASARDFSHLPDGPDSRLAESRRAAVQAAERERNALEQVSLSVWSLLATRYLAAGSSSLLPPPAAAILIANPAARVLDLGGQPTADWAWALALEHRSAQVHTVVIETPFVYTPDWRSHRGPRNHRVATAACAWSLPFADNSVHVISARTLHTLLRDSHGFDEWQATLAEVRRVLAPGGVFCYEAMDAEIRPLNTGNASAPPTAVGARHDLGPALAARSAEFAVAVRQLGYSPSAGQLMPQRLMRAGFTPSEVTGGRRAWVSLPLARGSELAGQGAEPGVEAVTSLVAAVAWERWMLGLQREMGRPRERLLDGVAKALDEASSSGAWRVLRGWIRKD